MSSANNATAAAANNVIAASNDAAEQPNDVRPNRLTKVLIETQGMVNVMKNHTEKALALSHGYAFTDDMDFKLQNDRLKEKLDAALMQRDNALA